MSDIYIFKGEARKSCHSGIDRLVWSHIDPAEAWWEEEVTPDELVEITRLIFKDE